ICVLAKLVRMKTLGVRVVSFLYLAGRGSAPYAKNFVIAVCATEPREKILKLALFIKFFSGLSGGRLRLLLRRCLCCLCSFRRCGSGRNAFQSNSILQLFIIECARLAAALDYAIVDERVERHESF